MIAPIALLLPSVIIVSLIVFGWFWYEGRWDRRLFAARPGRICENLRAATAIKLLRSSTDLQVLDVRSPAELAVGALPGAINIPLDSAKFTHRLATLDRTKPVLVYCAGGYRSRKAVDRLLDAGFKTIHHLHRGYHSWRMAGGA